MRSTCLLNLKRVVNKLRSIHQNYGFYEDSTIKFGAFAASLRENLRSEWVHFINQLENVHLVELGHHNGESSAERLYQEIHSVTSQIPVNYPIGVAMFSPDYYSLLITSKTKSPSDLLRILSQQRYNWWDEFILHGSLDVKEEEGKLKIMFKDTVFETIETTSHYVHSHLYVDSAAKGLVSFTNNELKLHKRLAPYKVAVIKTKEEDVNVTQVLEELSDQACRLFRANMISCIVTDDFDDRLDKLGVPFALKLSANTIKTGVVQLRDIDTKIWGDVHLSSVLQRVLNPLKRSQEALNFPESD